MSHGVEATPSGRYRGAWRLGRGPIRKRTFDFEWQAEDWATSQETDAAAAAADLRAVTQAAQLVATGTPAPRRRGRPLLLPAATPPSAELSEPLASAWTTDSLAEYGSAWLRRQTHLSEKGRDGYLSELVFIRDWHSTHPEATVPKPLGAYPIAELDQDLIKDWIADQVAENDADGEQVWSHRTINGRLSRVRQVATAAALSHKIAADPTVGIKKLPEKAKRPHRELTDDELEALLAAATSEERIWLLLGLRAGLRWGEVFGLPVDHLRRTDAGIVVVDVRQVNQAKNATIRTESTKTGQEEDDFRTVPLPPAAGAEVWAYAERVRAERGDSALLFATTTGSPVLYRNWLRGGWVKLRRRAGLHRMRKPAPPQFHDLRHTYLTWLGRGGASAVDGTPLPLIDVMALAGHSKIETAQKYQHASRIDEHAAMVARVFDPDPTPPTPEPEAQPRLRVIRGGAA